MNVLHVGTGDISVPRPPFLLIDDGPLIDALSFPRRKVTVFDPTKHSFNPLSRMNHRRARDFASLLYQVSPQGENTLTVRNGRRALAQIVLEGKRLDNLSFDSSDAHEEAKGTIDDLLFSPVLKNVLTRPTNFSFKGTILARLDRKVLGDDDCFILGNLLISQYHGQVIIPDFNFYGCPFHRSLVREERLIARVTHLDKLKDDLLLIKDKRGNGTTFDDAETLADYAHLIRGTNEYNDFVTGAMR